MVTKDLDGDRGKEIVPVTPIPHLLSPIYKPARPTGFAGFAIIFPYAIVCILVPPGSVLTRSSGWPWVPLWRPAGN